MFWSWGNRVCSQTLQVVPIYNTPQWCCGDYTLFLVEVFEVPLRHSPGEHPRSKHVDLDDDSLDRLSWSHGRRSLVHRSTIDRFLSSTKGSRDILDFRIMRDLQALCGASTGFSGIYKTGKVINDV